MIIRRLRSIGGASFNVTLPKKWVEEHGLSESGTVFIQEYRQNLLVLPHDPSEIVRKCKIISVGGKVNQTKRELVAAYLGGYVEVVVVCQSLEVHEIETIEAMLATLIGFEIVEKSANEIFIKNVFDPTTFPVMENLDKMFDMTSSMCTDAYLSLIGSNNLTESVMSRDKDVDRLYFALLRQEQCALNTKSFDQDGLSFNQLKLYVLIGLQLERIADHASKVARVVSKMSNRESQKIKLLGKLFQQVIDQILIIKAKLATGDRQMLHASLDKLERLRTKCDKMIVSGFDSQELEIILDSIDRIISYLVNIGEFGLDLQHVK